MRNYIRTHSKKILAVLGVILMVAFIIPPAQKYGGDSMSRRLIGHAGEQKIYNTDLERAKHQWEFLENAIVLSPSRTNGQQVSLIEALRQDPGFRALGDQITSHPELFYLLQLEAERMGVLVTASQTDAFFKQMGLEVRLQTSTHPIVPLDQVTEPTYAAAARDAVAAFIKVRESLNRAMLAVKVSRPRRHLEIERQLQQIQVSAVGLAAKDFLSQVPAPTPQQLQEHFDRFADSLSGAVNPQNPHGFGYKYPNRVTLQYIGVRRDDVKAAVRATQSDDRWEVEARKYYLRHQNQFPTSQSSTLPSTLPATTQPAAPTTKPFEEVREQILEQLMAPEVQRKARDAQDRINTRLIEDWNKWKADHPVGASTPPTTAPTTAPTTVPASGFASFEYLQQLAADVQKQTNVLPVIATVNELQSAKELADQPGIGQAFAGQMPFAQYVTELAADVVRAEDRGNAVVLQRYQPSPWLRTVDGSVYAVRITGGSPAIKPASMAEVAQAVERDYKLAQAYELAKRRGNELLAAATKAGSLESAASANGLRATTTETFGANSTSIPGIELDSAAVARFRAQSLDLLGVAATQPSANQPSTQPALPALKLIELPVQQQVFVAQLISAKPRLDMALLPYLDAEVEGELTAEDAGLIRRSWYDFNSVAERMKWKDDTAKAEKAGT